MAGNEAQLLDRVRELVERTCEPMGIEVLDVELRGQGPRRVVRVTADVTELDPSAALDVGTIARASHRLGEALDAEDVVPGSYTLEVTSPGADRPLRTQRDFARNIGREVRVVREGQADVVGELVAAAEETITIRSKGADASLPLAEVDHGKVVLPW